MPTLNHNAVVNMFRDHPEIAPRFVKTLFKTKIPKHAAVTVADSALDQLKPSEHRADLVLELRNDRGKTVLAIVLEVQRSINKEKKLSWPVYLSTARESRDCPTVILIVATNPKTARWADQWIDLGLGLSFVRTLVIGPAVIPKITDPNQAKREAELAILSALTFGNEPEGTDIVLAAFEAVGRLENPEADVYYQIILESLRTPIRAALETMIMEKQAAGNVKLPPFLQTFIERGRTEGLREGELKGKKIGIREGKEVGIREGELKAKRETLLRLLSIAKIPLNAKHNLLIQKCTEPEILEGWIENVLGAKTAADIFS